MSEFLAQARVVVRPDTTGFRALLQEQVNRAISQTQVSALQVPIAVGGGLAAAAGATGALANAQRGATVATADLAKAAQLENTAFGRQAVILPVVTRETLLKAGADTAATKAAATHAVAQGQVGKAAIASTAGMLGLRGAVLTAGTAFIAATVGFQALGKAIGSAISFERELNVFQVTAGATADQMERVQIVARELGRDITLPGVAANDAAQTLSLLARAGLSVEDSLNAVRGTLQLATAAEIENADAAELVANALNSFKLDGAEATRVADLLAGAANQSQGSITDMGLALKQTASIASGLGISIEDTVTILTQLSRAGLSASDAGTSFRQTLLRLIQDLPKVNKEVENLGLKLRDVDGNIRPEVFEELGRKLNKLTPAARQLAIANLGGADAIRTLLILTRAAAGEFDAVEASITQAGLAQELAAARTKGLGGDVESAKNQFADLGLTVGKVASGPLSNLVRTAGQAAGALNSVAAAAEKTGGNGGFLTQFGLVVNDLAGSFGRLNISFQQGVRNAQAMNKEMFIFTPVMEAAANATTALADALNAAGAATIKKQGAPKDEGLGVQQLINRVSGFDSAETRARIRGDTDELLSVLQEEQDFLNAQLERQFVQNRPALRDRLQDALLGTVNDIASIQKTGASSTKTVAAEAGRAQQEADQALLELLSNRREDLGRAGDTAEIEGRLGDAIRFEDRLQALIKQQILKIRAQIQNEKEKKAAVRELRIALIASRKAEDALRAERAQEAAARKVDAINLDIDFAEITGNVAREIAGRLRLIAQLRKQQAGVKRGTNEWKQLRNDIATQRQAIKDAKKEADEGTKDGQTFQQASFAFLQRQQGFTANLLSNLIPSGATAGLVGGTAQAAGNNPLGLGVTQESHIAQAKDAGFSAGQGNTTNSLLREIRDNLKILNGHSAHPEARNQRVMNSGSAHYLVS